MRIVYQDLSQSVYLYNYEGLDFYFSSEFNLGRFQKNVDDFVKMENLKMQNRYKVRSNWNLLLAISFYKKIEKRGFRIEEDSGRRILPEDIIFAKLK